MNRGPCVGGSRDGQVHKAEGRMFRAIRSPSAPKSCRYGEVPSCSRDMGIDVENYHWFPIETTTFRAGLWKHESLNDEQLVTMLLDGYRAGPSIPDPLLHPDLYYADLTPRHRLMDLLSTYGPSLGIDPLKLLDPIQPSPSPPPALPAPRSLPSPDLSPLLSKPTFGTGPFPWSDPE